MNRDWFDWDIKPIIKPNGDKAVYVTHRPSGLTAWDYADPRRNEEYENKVEGLQDVIEQALALQELSDLGQEIEK